MEDVYRYSIKANHAYHFQYICKNILFEKRRRKKEIDAPIAY